VRSSKKGSPYCSVIGEGLEEEEMNRIVERVLIEPFGRFLENVLAFLPDVLMAVLIFIFGAVLAVVLRTLLARLFRAVGLDRLSGRTGVTDVFLKGGIHEQPSLLLARLMAWLVIVLFSFVSLYSLNVPAVQQILQRLLLYLPNLFAGFLVLILGYLAGNFFGRAALIAAVNGGMRSAGLVGKLVKTGIVLLALTIALEQVGIGPQTAVIAFAIVFGGVVLALALAFGLGGTDMARKYLEDRTKGDKSEDRINHL
jgi:hypothetical protein